MGKATRTILMTGEDENVTRTFVRILQKSGYQTDTAQTAEEAIQKAKHNSYAAVLIDICHPDMNDMEFLDEIVNHDGKMVKIIITSDPTMPPNKGARADAYLLKPVSPQELLSIIDRKTTKK